MPFREDLFNCSNIGQCIWLAEEQKTQEIKLSVALDNRKIFLSKIGVKAGDVVIVAIDNSIILVELLMALWQMQACVVPISESTTPIERNYFIKKINPRFIIEKNDKFSIFENSISRGQLAVILFTSGSTGNPKAVAISYQSISRKMQIYKNALSISDFDRTLCMLPLHFGHGLFSNFLFPLLNGNSVYLTPSYSFSHLVHLSSIIQSQRITCFSSVPSMLKLATNFSKPFSSSQLLKIFCASSILTSELAEQTKKWSSDIPLCNMYGLTEALAWVAGNTNPGPIFKESHFELPFEAQFKIVEEELWINSTAMFDEYLNDSTLTTDRFNDGWFKTGDLAVVESNQLRLLGRTDDVINLSGIKVYPEEVNQVLRKLPAISEVETLPLFGSSAKDVISIGTIIKLKENHSISREEITAHCKQYLIDHKVPKQVKFVTAMPLNSRGKIDRNALKKLFE